MNQSDTELILEIFKVVAVEFSEVSDTVVLGWIELTIPLVSKKRFRNLYNQAVALLTAHRMKLVGVGSETSTDELDTSVSASALLKVSSYSEGETSISLNSGALTSKLDPNAEYALTIYGVQYLSLMSRLVVPIMSAGEN